MFCADWEAAESLFSSVMILFNLPEGKESEKKNRKRNEGQNVHFYPLLIL